MIYSIEEIKELIKARMKSHGLTQAGWTHVIVESLDGKFGKCDHDNRTLYFSSEFWPTSKRNIKELMHYKRGERDV